MAPASATGKVGPGDAHVRLDELPAQFSPRHPHKSRDVIALPDTGFLGKGIRNLRTRKVDGRQHHVRRPLMPELDNPFRKIAFDHVHAIGLKRHVGLNLLHRHGLGFD